MSRILIGTSGWSYDHWRSIFYPDGLPKSKWLEFYCRHFKTVELNTSFYHLPKRKTFENWRVRAGKDFVFSIKGSRFITHIKKLKDCREPVGKFFEAARGLLREHPRSGPKRLSGGEVAEVILWQLPPQLKFNLERLKAFLDLLPGSFRHAFEFRNETWLNDACYHVLKHDNRAVVFQDFEYWPVSEKITADFVYLRLHGRKELYASCYTKKELENWAKKIKNWNQRGLDVYVYFNNDMRGYAIKNANQLFKMLR